MKKYLVILVVLSAFLPLLEAQENRVEKDALDAISQAEKDVQEMQEMGFGVVYVNDMLIEAKEALQSGEYVLVLEKAREIDERKQRAYAIRDSLRALELRIEEINEKGLNTAEAEELFDTASTSFQNEDYDEAEELIFQADTYLNDVEAEYTLLTARYNAARDNAISYINRHEQDILIIAAALLVIGLISYNRIRVIKTKRKLRDMEVQKEVLADLINKTQIDYFQRRAMLRETYDMKMKKYRKMMLEIKETVPILQAKLGKKLD
jgi:cellobiose-specific phosphotransferase system component IIA